AAGGAAFTGAGRGAGVAVGRRADVADRSRRAAVGDVDGGDAVRARAAAVGAGGVVAGGGAHPIGARTRVAGRAGVAGVAAGGAAVPTLAGAGGVAAAVRAGNRVTHAGVVRAVRAGGALGAGVAAHAIPGRVAGVGADRVAHRASPAACPAAGDR